MHRSFIGICSIDDRLGVLIRGQKTTDFTVEEHIERISERIEKRYMQDGSPYTDYKVYPLYEDDDSFADFCLVEFEPYGYLYVEIYDTITLLRPFGLNGMYGRGNYPDTKWQRYRIRLDETTPDPYNDSQWLQRKNSVDQIIESTCFYEADKNGEFIFHDVSHFKAANIENEKRYFLRIQKTYSVPAVKRGDKFFSLISMEEFTYDPSLTIEDIPCGYYRCPPKKIFDL